MGSVAGGDKCLMTLGGRTVLEHVIERAAPQVNRLVLNANGDAGRFASFGLPVIADSVGEGSTGGAGARNAADPRNGADSSKRQGPGKGAGVGPLAGVLAGLDWAAGQMPDAGHVASFATDTPFFPTDLVRRLYLEIERGAQLACARSGGRLQPVFAVWPVALRHELRRALVVEGVRKVDRWTARYRLAVVDYAVEPFDPFFNLNKPAHLAVAASLLR